MLKSWSETDRLSPKAKAIPSSKSDAGRGIRLNVFQRLARQWDLLHPYNGAQALRIRGEADVDALRAAWHDAMESMGLGEVRIAQDSYRYYCLNGQAIHHSVVQVPAGTSLEDWISQEINRPFDADGAVPFRPFVIQDQGHYWMGICYQHWVADSASVRMLMREWFVRVFDPKSASRGPIRTWAGGYLRLFGPHREGWRTAEAILSSLRWHSQFRRARRIEDPQMFGNMSVRFRMIDAPANLVAPLCTAAKRLGVTVNDLFLAAIAESCNRFVPAPRRYRRRDLAIGTIVDLRPRADQPIDDVFNLFLGFTSVCCRPAHLAKWETLLSAVSTQTQRQKRAGLPLASWIRMIAGLVAGRYLSREDVVDFYRKRVSLAGANSNVNLNGSWASRYHPGLLEQYVRVAPTGPMTPLVFAMTTMGSELSIGLTYRPAILPPDRAGMLAEAFLKRISDVARLPL